MFEFGYGMTHGSGALGELLLAALGLLAFPAVLAIVIALIDGAEEKHYQTLTYEQKRAHEAQYADDWWK